MTGIRKVWYDTEFLELGAGAPISLISIGMVRDDGAELYCINADFHVESLMYHPWHMTNTVPSLPIRVIPDVRRVAGQRLVWDKEDPRWEDYAWPHDTIRDKVHAFLTEGGVTPELWAWYGAYDHVCLAQLWGTMSQMPRSVPFYTNDIKQLHHQLGEPDLPIQSTTKHHALADAQWNRRAYETLRDVREQHDLRLLRDTFWIGHKAGDQQARTEHRASCKSGTCEH